ncbi:MAG TPA: RDD family protein [Thermoanaerobaculia bacterium]|nr:RDD family protein [Thermoanaerobaculia bacterium]
MRRPDEDTNDEPLLFDLPLSTPERPNAGEMGKVERRGPAERAPRTLREDRAPAPPELPLAAREEVRRGPTPVPSPEPAAPEEEPEPTSKSGYAGLGSRLAAGAADLLVHAAIAVVALAGIQMMGIRPAVADWPALLTFLLSFSFLYMVVPLAFWGHTLGMTWANITSRNPDGEPLTFDQTARRWLGSLLTTATLGIPLFVAGRGRSLSDWLSGSGTYSGEAA